MRRLPRLAIVTAPLALEALFIAAVHPELGLLQMDGFGTGVERALNPLAKILAIVRPGAHVIDIAAVADLVAGLVRLGLVFVVHAVEPAIEIILIVPPRDARHDVDADRK